jgi:hypothetical protein
LIVDGNLMVVREVVLLMALEPEAILQEMESVMASRETGI